METGPHLTTLLKVKKEYGGSAIIVTALILEKYANEQRGKHAHVVGQEKINYYQI